MEDDELETWYDEEKEKLTEKYRQAIEKGNKDRLKKGYLRRMDSLHREYERRSASRDSRTLWLHNLKHRLAMIRMSIFGPIDRFLERFRKT